MKINFKKILIIAIVPIIWGAFADLKYGQIDSFVIRVICVIAIACLIEFIYDKVKAIIKQHY